MGDLMCLWSLYGQRQPGGPGVPLDGTSTGRSPDALGSWLEGLTELPDPGVAHRGLSGDVPARVTERGQEPGAINGAGEE